MARCVVLDTESTGLKAELGHRIIEIGAVEIVDRRITGRTFQRYLNPGRDSDPEALRVHGITTDFLKDKPDFAEVADDLISFMTGADLIAHKASFDISMLNNELMRMGRAPVSDFCSAMIDTLRLAKEMSPGRRAGLDALCDRHGVDRSKRTQHGALLDARLLAEVYIAMTRSQESMLDLFGDPGLDHSSPAGQPARKRNLSVVRANCQELEEHAVYIEHMREKTGVKPLWSP